MSDENCTEFDEATYERLNEAVKDCLNGNMVEIPHFETKEERRKWWDERRAKRAQDAKTKILSLSNDEGISAFKERAGEGSRVYVRDMCSSRSEYAKEFYISPGKWTDDIEEATELSLAQAMVIISELQVAWGHHCPILDVVIKETNND